MEKIGSTDDKDHGPDVPYVGFRPKIEGCILGTMDYVVEFRFTVAQVKHLKDPELFIPEYM